MEKTNPERRDGRCPLNRKILFGEKMKKNGRSLKETLKMS